MPVRGLLFSVEHKSFCVLDGIEDVFGRPGINKLGRLFGNYAIV